MLVEVNGPGFTQYIEASEVVVTYRNWKDMLDKEIEADKSKGAKPRDALKVLTDLAEEAGVNLLDWGVVEECTQLLVLNIKTATEVFRKLVYWTLYPSSVKIDGKHLY